MKLNFRKKILISYIVLFLIFIVILHPILTTLSEKVIAHTSNSEHLVKNFTYTFFLFFIVLLLIFGVFALFVVNYLTRPIKEIISQIKAKVGNASFEISLENGIETKDEFGLLADTLNALSKKIQKQITTLSQERNEKGAILESLGEGVIAVDERKIITYINHIAEGFLNIKKDALLGKNFALSNQKECYALIEQAEAKGEAILSFIRSESKPRKYYDVLVVPRKEGGVIIVLQDKTSLHRVIEKGRDFIANASHELKTPITIIRGFAETLHDHPELTKEVSQEITKKIVSNCQRMDTLIKNLLILAALDEGLPSSRLHDCNLLEISEKAKMIAVTVHPDALISIEQKGKEKPYLKGDSDLLFQAILNLLDNAAKYSKHPANIMVSLEKKPNSVEVEVKDQGIGIPDDELDKIFDRFYSVNKSHSRSLGGSFLGAFR